MIVGVLLSYVAAPLGLLAAVLVWMRVRRAPDERRILEALDRVLEQECVALKETGRRDPLRFRTEERVPLRGVGFGLGIRPGRADIVRMVRASTPRGYRLRLRAFVRVTDGRTLMRHRDVELRRR